MKHLFLLCTLITGLTFPSPALSSYVSGSEQLSAEGAGFTWEEAQAKSLRIVVDFQDRAGNSRRATLGSGFLIASDGLFVTAYHVMKHCLESQREKASFSSEVNCSADHQVLRYKALNGDREFEIDIISHLAERDSMGRASSQTPDETIKHRDFVIGKLKAGPKAVFRYWNIRDFREGTIDIFNPSADFELQPLFPPKKVFIAGYPEKRDFVIAHGFLNLTEAKRRGYFATDLKVYTPAYLKKQGISPNAKWGIRVENQMSGGPVVDAEGFVIGLVVNGKGQTTGILSIENVLETFLSRSDASGGEQAVVLTPTKATLYLKKSLVKDQPAKTLISKSLHK
ncbi:MAG: S1 family peptidase [Candidatus Binatia bacterium]